MPVPPGKEGLFFEAKIKELTKSQRFKGVPSRGFLIGQQLFFLENPSGQADGCGVQDNKIQLRGAKSIGKPAEEVQLIFGKVVYIAEVNGNIDIRKRLRGQLNPPKRYAKSMFASRTSTSRADGSLDSMSSGIVSNLIMIRLFLKNAPLSTMIYAFTASELGDVDT